MVRKTKLLLPHRKGKLLLFLLLEELPPEEPPVGIIRVSPV